MAQAQTNQEHQVDEPAQEAAPQETATTRPAARFSGSGGLSVAVWKHKSENGEHYSVRLDRSYKDQEGQYQSTPYLGERDLLRARELLLQADAWIEKEKAKFRGASAAVETGAQR